MFFITVSTAIRINHPRNPGDANTRAGSVSLRAFRKSSPSRITRLMHGSSEVERRAVNATVTGSSPVRAATLKADKLMDDRQRHSHQCTKTIWALVGDRQAVRQPALNRSCAGSNPALPGPCLSSSSRRPSVVVRVTRARIPSGTPNERERSSINCRHLWRCLLMVRKSGFQPENASSILVSASTSTKTA